ncbi:MAG: CRISPR-associated helicase Cas3' [Armatimonadetes bacterium]|nr:CRISPR-associated helicase Cas3' [Armatimonadota bacterium]
MSLWAKPNETLDEHTRRVVEIGRFLAQRLNLPGDLAQRVELACVLHDVGKATRSFQKRIEAARKASKHQPSAYPHALASFPLVLAMESQRFGQQTPKLATAAVLSHHSPLHPRLYEGVQKQPDFDEDPLRDWLAQWFPQENEQNQLQRVLRCNPGAWLYQEAQYPDGSRTLMEHFKRLPIGDFALVKALLCLADWLASAHKDPTIVFLSHGSQQVQNHLQSEKGLSVESLYAFQQRAREAQGEWLYLQAPTGTGKTEALLLWAGDSQRIIYLLPTQATVNAMWRRLQKVYGDENVGIAHSRALLELGGLTHEEPPLDVRLFASVFAKPVTVATLDQFLLAHLHGRHWEIRRALCQHATVLMDEIHAYEPYTLGLLQAAIESEPPARLAIASATLPSPLRTLLGDAPLIQAENELWHQRRHRLFLEERTPDDALNDALQNAARGECVLFVVNTVPLAQALYQKAVEQAQGMKHLPNIQLLHARFIYRDRREKEQTIEKPSRGTLLIATQVVEVSLDISYNRLYTELAPLDALVQRMGRVNRYGEQTQPAPVHVLRHYDPRSEHLYGKEALQETLNHLQTLPAEPTAHELRRATDDLYKSLWNRNNFQRELQAGYQTLKEVQCICGCYTIDLSDEQMRQRFTTRKGEIHAEVLPEAFLQEAYRLREQKALWKLPNLLVSIPYWWCYKFSDRFTYASDLNVLTTNLPYDNKIGLLHPLQAEDLPSPTEEWII